MPIPLRPFRILSPPSRDNPHYRPKAEQLFALYTQNNFLSIPNRTDMFDAAERLCYT